MTHNRFRGFTLIELLVVIAIIGILSAVVLASLTGARTKGNDAAIKSNMSTIQTEAEIYYGGAGANTYGVAGATSCATTGSLWAADATVAQAIKSITAVFGSEVQGTDYQCVSGLQTYMFASRLTATGQFWCLDNTGVEKLEATLPGTTATSCP
jgi:prepilin-type N-terminal cleavage/methylation domain-containing protein